MSHHQTIDLSACRPACPVEALGRRLAVIAARIEDLDASAPAGAPRPFSVTHQIDHLRDAEEALEMRLEWERPMSLAGVYVLALQAGVVADELAEADGLDRDQARRRYKRISWLMLEALERLGGLAPAELGSVNRSSPSTDYAEAMRVAFGAEALG